MILVAAGLAPTMPVPTAAELARFVLEVLAPTLPALIAVRVAAERVQAGTEARYPKWMVSIPEPETRLDASE
jgi:hypothetical protein